MLNHYGMVQVRDYLKWQKNQNLKVRIKIFRSWLNQYQNQQKKEEIIDQSRILIKKQFKVVFFLFYILANCIIGCQLKYIISRNEKILFFNNTVKQYTFNYFQIVILVYLSPFKKLCFIHFKCTNITGKQIEDYLDTKYRKRFLESRFLDKMNFQYQEHFKNKFQNIYIGLRLILFRPLSFKNGQIVEKQIEEKVIGQLYEKIDLIRKMLLETLYSKLIDNCAHFIAITDELRLLSNLEQEVDYFISKNERQINRKIIEPSQLLKELGQIQEQIEKWKLLNQDLNENLNLMEYSFQKQKEEEQEAYELLQKRISQLLK